jgi:hypothetical protein
MAMFYTSGGVDGNAGLGKASSSHFDLRRSLASGVC